MGASSPPSPARCAAAAREVVEAGGAAAEQGGERVEALGELARVRRDGGGALARGGCLDGREDGREGAVVEDELLCLGVALDGAADDPEGRLTHPRAWVLEEV